MIILPQKSLHRLLLALLVLHPLVVFLQKTLKVFSSLLPVDRVAHLLSYLRREVIPDESLLRLISNLIPYNVIQVLYGNHITTFSLLHPPSQPINHPVRHASQSGQLAHSCASLQTTGDYLIRLLIVHFLHLDRVRNAINIQ